MAPPLFLILLLLPAVLYAAFVPEAEELKRTEAVACAQDYTPTVYALLLQQLEGAPQGALAATGDALPYVEHGLSNHLPVCEAVRRAILAVWPKAPKPVLHGAALPHLLDSCNVQVSSAQTDALKTCLRVVRRATILAHQSTVLKAGDKAALTDRRGRPAR